MGNTVKIFDVDTETGNIHITVWDKNIANELGLCEDIIYKSKDLIETVKCANEKRQADKAYKPKCQIEQNKLQGWKKYLEFNQCSIIKAEIPKRKLSPIYDASGYSKIAVCYRECGNDEAEISCSSSNCGTNRIDGEDPSCPDYCRKVDITPYRLSVNQDGIPDVEFNQWQIVAKDVKYEKKIGHNKSVY